MENRRQIQGSDFLVHHTITEAPDPSDPSYRSHAHSMYELYYFIRGDAGFVVNEKLISLQPGIAVLIPIGVTHNLKLGSGRQTYERMALHLSDSLITPFKSVFPIQNARDAIIFRMDDRTRVWFEENVDLLLSIPAESDLQRSAFVSILSLMPLKLSGCEQLTKICGSLPQISRDSGIGKITPDVNLTGEIIAFIRSHLSEPLSLESISSHFFMEKSYLNRQFKRVMDCTIWEFVVRERVFTARQTFMLSGDIQSAALACGFTDYSSFYRAYKRLTNRSPREDLKKK